MVCLKFNASLILGITVVVLCVDVSVVTYQAATYLVCKSKVRCYLEFQTHVLYGFH